MVLKLEVLLLFWEQFETLGGLSPSPHAKGIKAMTTVNGLMDKE